MTENYSPPPPQDSLPPAEPVVAQSKNLNAVFGVVIALLVAAVAWLGYQNRQLAQRLAQMEEVPVVEEEIATDEAILAEEEEVETSTLDYTLCQIQSFGITVTIPSDWTCKSFGEAQNTIHSFILTSQTLEIIISDGGRGVYCSEYALGGPGGVKNPSCVISPFYTSSKYDFKLELYKSNGTNGEVFGLLNPTSQIGSPYVSITWENMEQRDLTAAEKSQIIQVLDSLVFSN